MKLFLTLLLWLHCFTETTGFAIKNNTLDRSIDEMLFRIESSLRRRNSTEFASYFAPKFDSESWFKRYYSQLTRSQLESFVFRRYGHVDGRGKDFKFKFSESHTVKDHLLLRSFVAETKRTPTNSFAIQTIRSYGEY